ncbi:MAG TPA: glycosyltransferase [Gaiellaceae bacterium]|nr:glycosyltransferase [Gaiellaceae bacterium]
MRVVHLLKVTGVAGAEQHLLRLLPALRERGVDARFVGLDVAGSDAERLYAGLADADVPAEHLRCTRDVSPRMARDVVRAIRALEPDLLHTHLVHADVYGSVASRMAGVPFVSTRHNDDRYQLGPFRYVDRAFAARASRLIAISDAVRRFLVGAGLPDRKFETIHYGLDDMPSLPSETTPEAAGIREGAPLVLAIGRLIAQKDHATLLRAFAQVHERHPAARLAILGEGPLRPETEALVRELGLADAVVLPGRLETRDWLERADVFVHSSRWEGFGIVLLEAMLAGLPVAATRVSAVPEIVVDGETGVLVEPGDASALATALGGLLDDPLRARVLGAAGLERARSEFSVSRMTDATLALYERL